MRPYPVRGLTIFGPFGPFGIRFDYEEFVVGLLVGVLISLLVLPLYIPVLIFGVGAVDAAVYGLAARPHLLVLGAMLIAALPLCPWASAAALRLSVE